MRHIRPIALLAGLALAPAARADFEGILEGRMTATKMKGTFKALVGKTGVRSEMSMSFEAKEGKQAPGMPQGSHSVSLWRHAEPDLVYLLDEARKTYQVLDVKKAREANRGVDQEKWTVRRLGKDKVAGFSCEKVAARHGEGKEMELCVTAEISSRGALSRGMLDERASGGGLFQALKEAKVEGFPIRWVVKGKDEATMEVVSAKRQSVPASTFEIPSGWKKNEGPMGLSPEQQQQMEEAMKKLTPEQRKQMEEMMKGTGR